MMLFFWLVVFVICAGIITRTARKMRSDAIQREYLKKLRTENKRNERVQ